MMSSSSSRRILLTAAAAIGILLAALFAPIARNLFFLPTHYARHRSPHPPSPSRPTRYTISKSDIDNFRRDGLLVLRNVMPPDLTKKMLIAGDDLMNDPVRHCEMTKYTSPPIFHAYDRYCGRAQLIHDYLRDVTFTSPLTHVAAQLMGSDELDPIRQLADVFMAGIDIPRRWHSDYLAFQKVFKSHEAVNCKDGLIFWIPMEESYETKSGMLFLNGTSRMMEEHFADDPSNARSLFGFKDFISTLDKTNYVAPTLDLGDVIVFDQCTVHAASGINTERLLRRAYQLRFIRNFVDKPDGQYSKGFVIGPPQHATVPSVCMPQVWPHTLPEEDAIRAAGPVEFTRREWLQRFARTPMLSLLTSSIALKIRLFGDPGEIDGDVPSTSFDDAIRQRLFDNRRGVLN